MIIRDRYIQRIMIASAECLLLAESGSQNLLFLTFLTSALPPEAAIELIGW